MDGGRKGEESEEKGGRQKKERGGPKQLCTLSCAGTSTPCFPSAECTLST